MSRCRPLAWCVHEIYESARNDISEALSDLDEESDDYQEMAAKLNSLLEQMPEEPEDNTERWLGTLDLAAFKATVDPVVDRWLSEKPDYRFEDEFIDTDASPEGSVFQFFQSLDPSELNELGISFVDGDRPGSNLRYAVLEKDVEQANAVAERTRQPFRFRRR